MQGSRTAAPGDVTFRDQVMLLLTSGTYLPEAMPRLILTEPHPGRRADALLHAGDSADTLARFPNSAFGMDRRTVNL
jgi:hypothetical protein